MSIRWSIKYVGHVKLEFAPYNWGPSVAIDEFSLCPLQSFNVLQLPSNHSHPSHEHNAYLPIEHTHLDFIDPGRLDL